MKFYGHANLQNNEVQSAVMQTEVNFPSSPTVGRLIFKDKRVYICVEIQSGLPVWVPLTNSVDTFLHNQGSTSLNWTLNHNLATSTPIVQVYGVDSKMVIPNEITINDNNNLTISFSVASAGTAVVMYGDITGGAKPQYSFTYHQTSLSDTWIVNHALGYYPIVRVFIGTEEVQPVSIVHNTINQTTLTFNQQYVGYAVFA